MTRKEIVKALREFIYQFDGRDVGDYFVEDVLEAAADMLERDAPGWISVKDRVPEKSTLVLGVVHGHVGELAYINDRNVFKRRECPIEGVTHWAPLPEPPKEDEK